MYFSPSFKNVPFHLIATKWKEEKLSPHFDFFSRDIPHPLKKSQVVRHLEREKTTSAGHEIKKASHWLKSI